MRPRFILLVVLAFLAGGGLALGLYALQRGPAGPGVIQTTGKALIGGPFTLTDHTGRRVTEQDFRGKHMLVFFGFTHCPDICPAELQVITAALEALGEKGEQVTPVFVSVDPKRDDVAQMAAYVSNFHPRMVGLTGSEEEIRAVAKAFRVYYAEVKDENSAAGYTVDHSSIVYLMSPQGEYLAHFAYGTKPDAMAAKIAELL